MVPPPIVIPVLKSTLHLHTERNIFSARLRVFNDTSPPIPVKGPPTQTEKRQRLTKNLEFQFSKGSFVYNQERQ
jgi:hypothetical protein